jgi:hypothetical protein
VQDLPQVGKWEALWTRHEAARRLFTDARHHLQSSVPLIRMGDNPSREESTAVLASSVVAHPVLGELCLQIYLDAPSVLFARQRTRTLWFGSPMPLLLYEVLRPCTRRRCGPRPT